MKVTKIVLALSMLAGAGALARADHGDCIDCDKHKSKKACTVFPEVKKEKRLGFDVECKEICIPKFRFSWGKKKCGEALCEEPRCGKVRKVNVLKLVEEDVERVGYKSVIHECPDECPPPCADVCAPVLVPYAEPVGPPGKAPEMLPVVPKGVEPMKK